MKTEDDELEPELKAFLRREIAPSDLLEERVVRALKAKGLLRSSRLGISSTLVSRVARLAAALLVFFSGLAVGQWTAHRSKAPVAQQAAPMSPALFQKAEIFRRLYWF